MRSSVEKRQKNARRNLQAFIPVNLLGLLMQQLLMKLVLREAFSGLLVQQFGADSLITTSCESKACTLSHRSFEVWSFVCCAAKK
jgi:hypothetical protein